MCWDKPFKTYEEQIKHLQDKYKLIIPDTSRALNILANVPYYDLINGYKECFMSNDVFQNTTIEDIYQLMVFDRNLQNVLFKYSVFAENRFKNILAYHLSKTFGVDVDSYISSAVFQSKHSYEKIRLQVHNIIDSDYLENPTKHYKINKNHVPPWILFKNMTFNDTIDIYYNLNASVKKEVCNDLVRYDQIDNPVDYSFKALVLTRKFRNTIAHNLKFIQHKSNAEIKLKDLSRLYGGSLIEREDFRVKRGRNDIYAFILSLASILKNHDLVVDFFWDFMMQVKYSNGKFQNSFLWKKYCQVTNIPENLSDRMLKFMKV